MVDSETCDNCDGYASPTRIPSFSRTSSLFSFLSLLFYVDNVLVVPLLSHVLQWKIMEFNVTAGIHDFVWTYRKDISLTRGTDRAYVQYIELHGTAYAQGSCAQCPPGTISTGVNTTWCTPCDYNQFNPNSGQTSCQLCNATQSSFQGATTCNTLPRCSSTDYYSTRGLCNMATGNQTISYQFATLANGRVNLCADPGGILPAATTAPCSCAPGTQLNANGVCQFCADGMANNATTGSCYTCVRVPLFVFFCPLHSMPFFSFFLPSCPLTAQGICCHEGPSSA